MKLATDKSHRDYFYKHGMIEFDALLNSDQIQELNVSINKILMQELAIPAVKLERQNAYDLFMRGHDLFRKDDGIKKNILHRRLAEIAVELMEVRALRIGYDQLLSGVLQSSTDDAKNVYTQYLQDEGSLQDKSCIKPVICGLLVCLEPADSIEIPPALLSKTPGSGVYFKPDLPFDLTFLAHAKKGRYLLITYADPRTVYILNDKDPHTHSLKHRGYVFGDRLSDKLNPLVYKG